MRFVSKKLKLFGDGRESGRIPHNRPGIVRHCPFVRSICKTLTKTRGASFKAGSFGLGVAHPTFVDAGPSQPLPDGLGECAVVAGPARPAKGCR